jgi:2-dehydropantoate 2-reductase
VIVPVLNGMKHVDALKTRFGEQAVAGGVCKIAATIDDQDRVVQLAPFHDLAYGEMNGAASERMATLDAFMQGAGFDARLSSTIEREMWEKWIFLSSLGAITCLMRGTIGETEAAPGGLAFANALVDEVVAIVRAVGSPPGEAFLATVRGQLTAKGSPLTSSMYRDLQKGGSIEGDQIIGDLLARGQQAGIAAPLLAASYANLSVYQGRLAKA